MGVKDITLAYDNEFNAGWKIWLEKDGITFGDGLFLLLNSIARVGSISQAAGEMKMSYRSAWGKIKEAEKRWGVCLVKTQVGGETGGGASLTPEAQELLIRYQCFKREVDGALREIFVRAFLK